MNLILIQQYLNRSSSIMIDLKRVFTNHFSYYMSSKSLNSQKQYCFHWNFSSKSFRCRFRIRHWCSRLWYWRLIVLIDQERLLATVKATSENCVLCHCSWQNLWVVSRSWKRFQSTIEAVIVSSLFDRYHRWSS